MKKIVIILLIVVGFLSSCYKDKSASDYSMINPIMIDMTSTSKSHSLYQFETLEITPVVYREGIKDSELTFEWTLSGNYIIPQVVGTNMTLKMEMNYRPYATAYQVLLRVTDKTTGIFVEQPFDVKVMSQLGTGLVVSDTRDEKSGDISLIMGTNFNTSLKKDTIMRDLFTKVHGRKVEAPINSVLSSKYGSVGASLTIATNQSVERVDPYDFSYMDRNEQMFIIKPDKYKVISVVNDANSGYDFLNNDGKIHNRAFQQGGKVFGYSYTTQDFSPYYAGLICKPFWVDAMTFDEMNGRFLVLSQSNRRLNFPKVDPAAPFAYDQFRDYNCISMTTGPGYAMYCIMQHKVTKEIANYVFITGYSANDVKASKVLHYPESLCPGIQRATAFASCETGGTLYYSVDDKIYGVNGNSDNDLLTTLEYTAPEGEVITGIYGYSHYRMGGYIKITNSNPNAKPEDKIQSVYSQNRMVVVTTYNKATKEGFIRTVGVYNVPRGTLEKDRELHGKFGGFGRITCISVQQ